MFFRTMQDFCPYYRVFQKNGYPILFLG